MEFHVVLPHGSSSDSDPDSDQPCLEFAVTVLSDWDKRLSPGERSHTSQQSAIMMDVAEGDVEELIALSGGEGAQKICKIRAHRVIVASR